MRDVTYLALCSLELNYVLNRKHNYLIKIILFNRNPGSYHIIKFRGKRSNTYYRFEKKVTYIYQKEGSFHICLAFYLL